MAKNKISLGQEAGQLSRDKLTKVFVARVIEMHAIGVISGLNDISMSQTLAAAMDL